MPKLNSLLVVAKQPVPGQTKTRLCPPLSLTQAANLYECLLRDTLDIMRKIRSVRCVIGFLPEEARSYFCQLAPDMELTSQFGKSLGERLDHMLSDALTSGSERAVVIDSDSPSLPPEYISRAFDLLEGADVVLGPSRDGGYYLIGVKQPQPHLFHQVQMSTPHVLADTLALAKTANLAVSLLPTWYDIDTIADLRQLEDEIAGMSNNENAVATRRWLAQQDWLNKQA